MKVPLPLASVPVTSRSPMIVVEVAELLMVRVAADEPVGASGCEEREEELRPPRPKKALRPRPVFSYVSDYTSSCFICPPIASDSIDGSGCVRDRAGS